LKQRALPEFFLENAWEYLLFMSRIDGDLSAASSREKDEILALAAELVPCGDLIKNPYIRAKQVELFFSLVMTEEERHNGVFSNLDDVVHKRLIPNCMKFYVQVEALGTSTAFYDKFSIRYHLTKILLKLLALKPNAFALPQLEQTIDDGNLVRFINLCVSDSTYLLDESLSKLSEIKEKQSQTEPLSAEEQKLLSQTERQCQSLLALGNESLTFLARLTSAIPAAFLRSEILDRLTAMLNFNLVLLAGPRCSKLKVSNPGKYNFNPRALLASLIEIYLSLSGEESFIKSVAGDERSFSTQLFDSCVGIMRRTGMSVEMINSFTCLSEKIISHLGKDSHDASGSGISGDLSDQENIPDEFLDPILFNVMVDPVRLPASQMVVDRSTIQAHLLNDPHDPFNRQVLTIEQVEPMPELKAQIEAFIKSTQLK
jgi:ubiquitin conjugation factor E4 B